ncbi:rhomboid family intramembrane serine protease [Aggregatilineales bacterium SYSU G02658]
MSRPPRHPLEVPPDDDENDVRDEQANVRVRIQVKVAERTPSITYGLIAVNIALYGLTQFVPDLFLWGALFPAAVLGDLQFQRLLTAMFLHASLPHIVLNMFALYTLGREVEMFYGQQRFLAIYFLGGLAGSIASAGIGNYAIPSVGASGAILAVWAAQMVFLYTNRSLFGPVRIRQVLVQNLVYLGAFTFIGFVPGSRVDNWAHIGGFIGGAAIAWLLPVRLKYTKAERLPPQNPTELAVAGTIEDTNRWSNAMLSPLLGYFGILVLALLLAMILYGFGTFPNTL